MNAPGWQDATVIAIAAGALAWLVRRRLARRRQPPGCEHCPANPGTRGVVTDFMPESPRPGRPRGKTPPTR